MKIIIIFIDLLMATVLFFVGRFFIKSRNTERSVLFLSGDYTGLNTEKICRVTGKRIKTWAMLFCLGGIIDFIKPGAGIIIAFVFFYYLTCISFGWYDYKSRQVPGINSSLLYSFLAGFGAGTPQQEAVPKGQEFSRIENLWPRDDSCPYLICSNSIFCDCFQIVKAHKQQKTSFF